MTSIYDMLYEIDNSFDGLYFDKIEGFSLVGEVRSNAFYHPIQYRALTTTRHGDDGPYEGIGWTPAEAIRNLLKSLTQKKENE